MARPAILALWLVFCLVGAGCTDAEDDIRAHVTLAVHHEGKEALAAIEHVSRHGRRAIPTVEAALHTAPPAGRKNLILALRKIADPECVPLLRQVALHDPAPDVRREAEWTLRQWAAGASGAPLTEAARSAVRALDEAKGSEEAG
jgi:HEAT repeat protein